jgi:hypothetical protein
MTLIQSGQPNSFVQTLEGASRIVLKRFRNGGPRTARVEDSHAGRYYVIEVNTFSRERKRTCRR